jgi:CHAD domain-containing protein
MKRKKQKRYLNKHFKKLQQEFEEFAVSKSPEALHAFRVQVKKIRSFLTLLETGKKNEKLLKIFKPVKKIFKSAGLIRNAQIHEKQAKQNHIDAAKFYKEQQAIQQVETEKLQNKKYELLHTIKKTKHKLQTKLHAISGKEAAQFFGQQFQNACWLLNEHNFTEQLHTARKMFKHILYNQHTVPSSITQNVNINFDDVDAIQRVIGDWHDSKLAIEFFSDKLSKKDIAKMKHKQQLLQKEVITKSRSFLN